MKTERYFIGDACLCWSFGDEISPEISGQVLSVFRSLNDKQVKTRFGIRDLAPSYNALAVYFDPATVSIKQFIQRIEKEIEHVLKGDKSKGKGPDEAINVHTLPVLYTGEDLERVADLNHLKVAEVIRLHQAPAYTVAMIGFQPHFPYLIGLDPRIETPRLDSPRTKVPLGSVAIGGAQTGIYPQESPGGWNIIGTTKPELLIHIEPGDTIIFKEVQSLCLL
ncbi:MAG: allophanate hydrolase subunit 1 [Deltaproteobacteria bacterium]|jgi:KipI family sensor histidine kinase inhibitor|nr:allophanate hydrolase subunit 1 [Deltaproteobacteria bacterium]MBT4266549.1 allophanate hydrolase subunit 1 [Deltaproteobacteria bacterium]MBT4643534.1 allophanate hydrolase subunit 1 [Deltaproteobacteria bacterium]MBT6500906.1 allophanate hydrolase subunit 1 [Deltaproteobacteria bacterium]MBT6616480.1 allophanate hydrolase subunit 1 [Deltaproteobacteria bacterium]